MAMWDELYEDVQKNGVSQMSPNTGTSSMRAEYRSMMQIGEECRRLETEFGLTPSSRTKIEAITAPEKATDDPKEKYFA
jgi:P27 family predicted phage terminase small subunit